MHANKSLIRKDVNNDVTMNPPIPLSLFPVCLYAHKSGSLNLIRHFPSDSRPFLYKEIEFSLSARGLRTGRLSSLATSCQKFNSNGDQSASLNIFS